MNRILCLVGKKNSKIYQYLKSVNTCINIQVKKCLKNVIFTQYLKANAKMPVFKVFKKSNFVSGILWTKPKNEGKELFKYS